MLRRLVLGPVLALLWFGGTADAQTRWVYAEEEWAYEASGADLGTAWRNTSYDDSGWSRGDAPIGYGSGINLRTDLEGTVSASTRTMYFRYDFEVADPSVVETLTLGAGYAQGFVAYLNGVEIARRSMPAGAVDASTAAMPHTPTALEDVDVTAGRTALVAGRNVLAVELHQTDPPAGLFVWAAELRYELSTLHVPRGPYIQQTSPGSAVVRFRTNDPIAGVVRYGSAPDALPSMVAGGPATTEHEILVTGLSPATRYYYAIGTATETLRGGDGDHFFETAPPPGTVTPVRLWVLGDSGTADGTARAVRDAYHAYAGERRTDAWLMLGDNAYPNGTDDNHQLAIFENAFEATARTTALWPTFGNHEWGDGTADPTAETGPYFDVFSLPENGEAGGEPSGREVFYSFDYANIHVICLNTHDPDPSILPWMEADLAAADEEWLIAFFHVPPYTHGTHDSDGPGHTTARGYAEVLEGFGVDLVLTGHSHVYERSILLDGHYDTSDEFVASPDVFAIDPGDGREDGDGAYRKPAMRGPHQGTVYVVAGNSGGRGGDTAPLTHPVMVELADPVTGATRRGLHTPGSLVIDVNGDRLDAIYLDSAGMTLDRFTILKGDGTGGVDAGPGPRDAGPPRADAGTTPPAGDDGGCCSVAPGAARTPEGLAALCVCAALAALRRRARGR